MKPEYKHKRITAQTTTAVSAHTAILRGIHVNVQSTGLITVNDGLGEVIQLPVGSKGWTGPLDALCAAKLEVVTAAADDLTVLYAE